MRCTLIVPPWKPEEIFPTRTAASQINYWQPLGILYVAASLLKAGHEVRFLNGAFLERQQILRELRSFQPRFVGLYATAFGWPRARQTARDVKALLPDAWLAVGGPYPIAMKEECLRQCPELDMVVTGEGEFTLVEALHRLSAGDTLAGVAGLAFRQGSRLIKNMDRPLVTDLDRLPFPARELLGNDEYLPPPATYRRKPVAVLITSRGCDRRCIYCFQIDQSRASGVRFRGLDNVLAEIEQCLAQGYREIKFIDDTLAADYQRAMRLADMIRERNLDFSWFASACANQVDEPLLQAFRKAGCWAILIGAESGVQKNLNTLRKGVTLAQIRRAVTAAKRAGLTVFTPFLFGIPGETFADGLKTIEFACDLDPDVANFHALTPFPGTELHTHLDRYGTSSGNLEDYTYQGAAFTPYTMTREEICQLRQLAFQRFYSRPRFLLRRLLALRTPADLKAAVHGLQSLFWLWAGRQLFLRGKKG